MGTLKSAKKRSEELRKKIVSIVRRAVGGAAEEAKRRYRQVREKVAEVVRERKEEVRPPSKKISSTKEMFKDGELTERGRSKLRKVGVEPSKFEEKLEEKKAVVKKEVKSVVRKQAVAGAASAIKTFESKLKEQFAPLEAKIRELEKERGAGKFGKGKTFRITEPSGKTRRVTLEQLKREVEAQKAKARAEFESRLEREIAEYEASETEKLAKEVLSSHSFRQAALKSAFSPVTGEVLADVATEEALKRAPKIEPRKPLPIREKIGVVAGKALALVGGTAPYKLGVWKEERPGKVEEAEALGVATVRAFAKGATLGLAAPVGEPVITTKEEAAFSAIAGSLGAEWVAAPAISKAVSFVSEKVPSVRKIVGKLPFVEREKKEVIELRPKFEEVGYEIKKVKLVGVRAGKEYTAYGYAYAFKAPSVRGFSAERKFGVLRATERIGGVSFLEYGKEKVVGGREIIYGTPEFRLPSPEEMRIFVKRGKLPTAIPVAEVGHFRSFERFISPELALKGAGVVRRGKAVETFFEVRIPEGVSVGTERLAEMVSATKRGATDTTKFITLGKTEVGGEVLKETLVGLRKMKPEAVFLDMPTESAGAATAPVVKVISTEPKVKVRYADVTAPVTGTLGTVKFRRLVGFEEVRKVVEVPKVKLFSLVLSKVKTPLIGVRPEVRHKVRVAPVTITVPAMKKAIASAKVRRAVSAVQTKVAITQRLSVTQVQGSKLASLQLPRLKRPAVKVAVRTRGAVPKVVVSEKVRLPPPVPYPRPKKVYYHVPRKLYVPKVRVRKGRVTFLAFPGIKAVHTTQVKFRKLSFGVLPQTRAVRRKYLKMWAEAPFGFDFPTAELAGKRRTRKKGKGLNVGVVKI